ncbi:hypothetical protein NIES4072_34320 [Nostoc commune NIES-4072]|uniref:Uncharacterized protein n=1 Tax=Nostoc commune NIES-4072 TaxID=2005467 RepID=A0A2R5FU72_NOSCO|nr:hypothetical protein NIES4070_56470 [Nostoc commune HK-02]GBG19763.1 hypothetical protein NIES4072_34320 [Nostoc commune NIES-4072]
MLLNRPRRKKASTSLRFPDLYPYGDLATLLALRQSSNWRGAEKKETLPVTLKGLVFTTNLFTLVTNVTDY